MMNIYVYSVFILCLSLLSCSGGQRVTLDGGHEYTAKLDSGTLAVIKLSDGTEVTFDRRGNPGIIEDILKLYAVKSLEGK